MIKKEILVFKNYNRLKRNLSISFLWISALMFSQDYPVKFGVKAGWNFSNVNAIDEIGGISGYISNGGEVYGGLVVEKQILPKSLVQISTIVSYTDRITFLELPVYYKYNFYNRFFFLVGPKLNYIPDDEISQPYNFNRRFGISADIGINYKISNHFTLEGTFSKGFTKQYDDLILTYYQARRDVYRIGVNYYF